MPVKFTSSSLLSEFASSPSLSAKSPASLPSLPYTSQSYELSRKELK